MVTKPAKCVLRVSERVNTTCTSKGITIIVYLGRVNYTCSPNGLISRRVLLYACISWEGLITRVLRVPEGVNFTCTSEGFTICVYLGGVNFTCTSPVYTERVNYTCT